MSVILNISRVLSAVFSPLLMPTYGMIIALTCSELHVLPVGVRLGATAVIFVLTGVLPFIVISGLSTLNIVKDVALTERTDRTFPYAVALVMYAAAAVYLYMVSAPWWMEAFMIGGGAALLIVAVVNRWWKISAHAAASGGLLAMVVALVCRSADPYSQLWLLTLVLILTGMVGSARIVRQCHTPAQVYAGFLVGFSCVILISII